jgi:WS/DGAT/MGAT family acyltransferase
MLILHLGEIWLRSVRCRHDIMTDVPLLDYAFLAFESEASPKHVAGLQVFERPEAAPDDFVAAMVEEIKRILPEKPFDQKLEIPLIGMPKWVEDTELDLDNHIFYEQAPEPRSLEALLRRLEELHAEKLDRSLPLWQLHIFDHLEDGCFAAYFKVHHAYMDGLSLSQRSMGVLSEDPDGDDASVPWADLGGGHEATRKGLMSELLDIAARTGRSALILPALTKLGLKHGLRLLDFGGEGLPIPFTAPRTAFNTPLTPERSIAVLDFPLKRLRRVARRAAVTVNDVLLELCDRAMTHYLDELGDAPDEPLIAQMPVSLRRPGVDRGNQISIAILELGSRESNPVRRLQDIHAKAANVKHEFGNMTPETAEVYTLLMQAVAQFGESSGADRIMPPLGNVVISNMAGPKKRLYHNGARLLAVYPISTIAPGLALNITVFSYVDTLHVGLVAGQSAIPDLGPITEYMSHALDELETAMGFKPARRKPQRQ